MDPRTIVTIMRKELRDAARNRWFVLGTAMLAGLALALSLLGSSGLGNIGISGFGRTAASLLHLVMLLVPLLGLLMGAMSVAAEREQGTLLTLLAQPVTAAEVLCGKFLGMAAAVGGAVLLGFGLSAVVIARSNGWEQAGGYLSLVGFTLCLGLAHVALGFVISVAARRQATAVGIALAVWMLLVFLSDLGIIGTAMVLKLTPPQLLWLSLGNPVQVFKLAAMQSLQGNLELLGSSGLYATAWLGPWLLPVLFALLCGWVIVPWLLAVGLFQRRGAL